MGDFGFGMYSLPGGNAKTRKIKQRNHLMSDEETVTIPRKEYDSLIRDSLFLSALEAAGIDNTDAYSHGCRMFYEENPEYDN